MSLTHEHYLLLSALADDELSGDERTDALCLLEESPKARAFVASLSVLGHAVHGAAALGATPQVDLADAIMAQIAAETPAASATPAATPATPLSLSEARARRAQASRVAAAIGALALAAAGLFYVRAHHAETAVGPVARVTPSSAEPADAEKGVEVRVIDSDETSQVSVFYLPAGANMASSVVVWIDDKGAP